MDGWMDGWMDVWMYGCMDVWMYGCMDGWMDGWMHACMHQTSMASKPGIDSSRQSCKRAARAAAVCSSMEDKVGLGCRI